MTVGPIIAYRSPAAGFAAYDKRSPKAGNCDGVWLGGALKGPVASAAQSVR